LNSAASSTFRARLTLFLLAILGTGCSELVPARFNNGEGLYEKNVLIVPFRERRRSRWYGESPQGTRVAEAIKNWARENWSADFPEGDETARVLLAVRDWTSSDEIPPREWKKLTASLGVEYVIAGDIRSIELRSPRTVGMLDASCTASYRVIDTSTGRVAFDEPERKVALGDPHEIRVPTMELGGDDAAFENKLLIKLGEEIGKDLYGYYRD
jgi:hypothetical protein